jgi:hypothetical protein
VPRTKRVLARMRRLTCPLLPNVNGGPPTRPICLRGVLEGRLGAYI